MGNEKSIKTFFCFEDHKTPSMMFKLNEDKLRNLFANRKHGVKCVVVSACHSSKLGKII